MSPSKRPKPRRLSFEGRILFLALLTGFFGSAAALALIWTGDFTPKVQWTLSTFLGILWLSFAFHLRKHGGPLLPWLSAQNGNIRFSNTASR